MEERIAQVRLMTEQDGRRAFNDARIESHLYAGRNDNVSVAVVTSTRRTAVVRVKDRTWNTVDYYSVVAENRFALFSKIAKHFNLHFGIFNLTKMRMSR